MASLMENLIDVLYKEANEYETLLGLSMKKTPIIVENNLEGLQKITDEEQEVVGRIQSLDKERISVTKDIANVLNMDVKTMKISDVVEVLNKRPEEQKKLQDAQKKLTDLAKQLQRVNNQNSMLIEQALELVGYEINLYQAMKRAPETANYNKGAYNTGMSYGRPSSGFDAKQ